MGRVVHLGVKTFTNGEILTAPILNASMWSFATYKATTDVVTIGSGGTFTTNYCRPGRGDLVFFNGHIVFRTSPSFSTVITVTLPTNANTSDFALIDRVQWCAGSWVFRDNSAVYHYAGSLGVWNVSGTEGGFGGAWDGTDTPPAGGAGRAGATPPSRLSVSGGRGVATGAGTSTVRCGSGRISATVPTRTSTRTARRSASRRLTTHPAYRRTSSAGHSGRPARWPAP